MSTAYDSTSIEPTEGTAGSTVDGELTASLKLFESALDLSEEHINRLNYLVEFLTTDRRHRLQEVVVRRTRHLTVVMEDLWDVHNISAVLRSCDAFGLQDAHVVQSYNKFSTTHKITRGADKWLTLHPHTQAEPHAACISQLRASGYQIVATTLDPSAHTPATLPLEKPTAIVFGNEHSGVSQMMFDEADTTLTIPMYGFSESLNISAAAAICLSSLSDRLREETDQWKVSHKEISDLYFEWVRKSIAHLDALEQRYFETQEIPSETTLKHFDCRTTHAGN